MKHSTLIRTCSLAAAGEVGQSRSQNSSARADQGQMPKSYFFQDSFADEAAAAWLFGPEPLGSDTKRPDPPKGLPAYLKHLWMVPLMSAEQELHCFRKLNYLKYLSARTQAAAMSCRGCASMLDDLADLNQNAQQLRNLLVESNLRLVVSLAKKYASSGSDELDEMVCVGNAALIRAVDLFDFRRGIRFSTYAYQAIQRAIFHEHRRESRIRKRFVSRVTEHTDPDIFDMRDSESAEIEDAEVRDQVVGLLEQLDERQKKIVMARFGMNRTEDGVAFRVIAKEIGLSCTRTVQLFHRSLEKMRASIGRQGKTDGGE